MKCTQKLNVIANIACYFQRGDVTLKLRKEYLSAATCNMSLIPDEELNSLIYGTLSYVNI